jgi:hypothetical protein
MTTELRWHLRARVLAPLVCSFARIGLQRWSAAECAGLGVVLVVSLNGAKVMSPASMNPGDQFPISLRLPNQTVIVNVDAPARCGNRLTFRLKVTAVSQLADTRTQKLLSRASSPRA